LEAGKNRGCIVSKGEIDLYRISSIILDEFRGGKIGKISLEWPQTNVNTILSETEKPT
jgi:ribosome biogenesis GTPase A